jgi:hypothetical protein
MRLLILLLALNAPILGAQGLLPAFPESSSDSASLQLEAVWLLTPQSRSTSPLERLVKTGTLPSERLGLRATSDVGPSLGASLALEHGTPAMALLCRSGASLVSLGAMAEHCLLAEIDSPADMLGETMRAAQAEVSWRDPGAGLDLSFGLFWLRPQAALNPSGLALPLSGFTWSSPTFGPQLRGVSLGVSKAFYVGEELKLILGGSLTRQELRMPGLNPAFDSNLVDMSLALEKGPFSGILNSRLLEGEASGARWQAIDLGIAWRTPWHGQLTVGARNLLGKSAPPALTPSQALGFGAETSLMDEPSQGRVPFVRYRQDL